MEVEEQASNREPDKVEEQPTHGKIPCDGGGVECTIYKVKLLLVLTLFSSITAMCSKSKEHCVRGALGNQKITSYLFYSLFSAFIFNKSLYDITE